MAPDPARLAAAAPALLAAARAGLAYDAALRRRGLLGDTRETSPGEHDATGADLDALYYTWRDQTLAAVALVDGPDPQAITADDLRGRRGEG
jgi:hypothetical protein